MNKQELIEKIQELREDGEHDLRTVIYFAKQLDEPSREECVPIHKLIDPRYSDYRLYCNFCDTEISSDDNYCGSCGRKIKREKSDE